MTKQYQQTLADIDVILENIGENEKNKIPQKLKDFIKENKDTDYVPSINTKIPIEDQALSEETRAFIAILYLNYWYKDEADKQELKSIIRENEKKYIEEISEKYSYDNLFKKSKNDKEKSDEGNNSKEIIKYKESIFKKILYRIFKR